MRTERLPETVRHGRVELVTLGGAEVVLHGPDGERETILHRGKAVALLAYLACSPRRTASRDHLIDLLWADSGRPHDARSARRVLRQTVWFIRGRLGEGCLLSNNDDLTLSPEVTCDRDAFLAMCERGAPADAVGLYAGEFFPGFAAPGGAEFEAWADRERQSLRFAYIRAAEDVVRGRMAHGHARDARTLAREMRDHDPSRQASWRLLIEACMAAGDPLGAVCEAEALERMLSEYECAPEPATTALLARVRSEESTEVGERDTGLEAELVGREEEFWTVLRAWDDACEGAGRHVHVVAPPGLGKTRLLTDVRNRLVSAGARAVYMRAHAGTHALAYGLASRLAEQLAALPGAAGVSPDSVGALLALSPALSSLFRGAADPARGDEALRRRTLALVELVTSVAYEQPIALFVDDIQWCDAESLQVVLGILASIGSHPVLVVTASRPSPEGALVAGEATRTLGLSPLGREQLAALLGSIRTLPLDPWAAALPDQLYRATAGSPLLILETLRLACERGTLGMGPDSWTCERPEALAGELNEGAALQRRVERLDTDDRHILTVLAVAGTPLDRDPLLAALGCGTEQLEGRLRGMEQRGCVARAGAGWELAHDELASLVTNGADADALRSAHAAVGLALMARNGSGWRELELRAARHFLEADRPDLLQGLYRKEMTRVREGDLPLRPRDVAREILGAAATPDLVRRLVRSLPWTARLSRRAKVVAAAAVAGLMLAGGAVATFASPPGGDADLTTVIVGVKTASGRVEAYGVPLREDGRAGGGSLRMSRLRKMDRGLTAVGREGYGLQRSPTGEEWAVGIVVPDSGGIEIFTVADDGTTRRLTHSPLDDTGPRWSPDGSHLVFLTSRWHPASHYELAVMDVRSGRTSRLTYSDGDESTPYWSPDGTRIAFLRRFGGVRPPEVCWATVDGGRERCHGLGDETVMGVEAWYDPRVVVIRTDSAGVITLRLLDVEDWRITSRTRLAGLPRVSPDGHWIASLRYPQRQGGAELAVQRVDGTGGARVVADAHDLDRATILGWHLSDASFRFIDELRIGPALDTLPVRASTHLLAHAFDPAGDPVTVPPVITWTLSDTSVATVDGSGMLHPRRSGTVTVHATVGGWRSASRAFVIADRPPVIVLREDWSGDPARQWVLFGDPKPVVVEGPSATEALWGRGDGQFDSGVYSDSEFVATDGLGIELAVSSPITRAQWQSLHVSVAAVDDPSALAAWDHVTGAPPEPSHMASCRVRYADPSTTPLSGPEFATFLAGGERFAVPMSDDVRSGNWYTVRLQILPDGRCGIAFNGSPTWTSTGALALDRPLRVFIFGQSVGTRVLVGPLELWQGVKNDIGWDSS